MGHRKADLCKPEPSFALFLFSRWENSSLATSGTGHQAEKQELGMDGQVFCVGAQQLCTHLYHRASKARSVFAGMKGEPRAPAHRAISSAVPLIFISLYPIVVCLGFWRYGKAF